MESYEACVIRLEGITKGFPGVRALKGVNFDLRPGEIHALCGENGAGKSTLIKVITGAHCKDEGIIQVDGKVQEFTDTRDALSCGISCVYQELSIVPLLDVAGNLYLGNLPMKGRIVDYKKLYADAEGILEKLQLKVSPHTRAGELSVGQQQLIEIGRALTRQSRVIIMDEPTSSLSKSEGEMLFEICAFLKAQGIAIVYISHKLDEVMLLADRITVIRDGENIVTRDKDDITQEELISHMIGRSLENMYNKQPSPHGDVALEVRHLTRKGVFEDVSFTVRSGEITGFFGLVGAGRSEIMRAVFGVDPYDSGEVLLFGKPLKPRSPLAAIRAGMAFATEDRKREGLMLRLSVLTNMTLVKLDELSTLGVIQRKQQRDIAQQYIEAIRIKTPSKKQLVVNLSGGNQQKVVLAKWLMMNPRLLIIDEPTRGIDVGSKAEIYALINELAQQGVAVVVVSSEIEEVMGLSDSIVTIFEGKKTAQLTMDGHLDRETILRAAIGKVGKEEAICS